jgi:abequosyltransferase
MTSGITLSICIPTINRPEYIGETLDSIVGQWSDDIEVLVVDASATDDTESIVRRYQRLPFNIRYYRSVKKQEAPSNSGFDMDCDRAVGLAQGQYCWLMTDDDIIKPGAIKRVLKETANHHDLIIVNAEVMNLDFTKLISPARMRMSRDRVFTPDAWEQFVACTARYLTFVGGVIVKRQLWLNRNKEQYFGTGFVHVGVIYQDVIRGTVLVLAAPLVTIRYGNALWSTRAFKIWMLDWPKLVWSFSSVTDEGKRNVCPSEEPWRNLWRLFAARARGHYSMREYREYLENRMFSSFERTIAQFVARFPREPLRILALLFLMTNPRRFAVTLNDLKNS